MSDNLLENLLRLFPSSGIVPRENFLSEAFAHALRDSREAANAWLSHVLGRPMKCASLNISTRVTERNIGEETDIYPDMLVEGILSSGESFAIYFEHKWKAPCKPEQLRRYSRLVKSKENGATLVFVGAKRKQLEVARSSLPELANQIFLWEDAYRVLEGIREKSSSVSQLLQFMDTHSLGPGSPITVEKMQAYLASSGFLKLLMRQCEFLHDLDWSVVPSRYQGKDQTYIEKKWGRCAVVFPTPEWNPTITFGFLFDPTDHQVEFVDAERGIDLFLRIEASPSTYPNPQSCLSCLKAKASEISTAEPMTVALTKSDRGNGNRNSLVIVRSCLADTVDGTTNENEQVERIHCKLTGWFRVLFEDGLLESAILEAFGSNG